MFLSLKGALGRNPMINRVGQMLLQAFEGASAAYSLRDLASNIASVVRVRRASDNSEADFSAADVSSGAMTQWVNAQIVPPLDIRELVDGERTGDLVEAAAAYSLRNLSASYTGNVVDVRRSSDDAEESFTAAEVADGTLVAWVGAGNDGFVSQWYDQSGNGNHATQGTPASQPKIVDGGSLVSGGLSFDGNDTLSVSGDPVITASSSGTYSAFSVQTVATSEGGYLYGNASSSNGSSAYALADKFTITNYFFADLDNIARSSGQNLLSAVYNNGDAGLLVNGAGTMTDAGTYNFSAGTSDFIIGNRNGGSSDATFLTGSIQEIIIYNSDQSDNRTAIEANIGDHYSIDLPSGVDTGYDQVDGFVETWYDQSGNGNDAVQGVAGSQPKIVDAGSLLNKLKFEGAQFLQRAFTSPLSQPNSSFVVAQMDAGTGNTKIFDGVGSLSRNALFASNDTDFAMFAGSIQKYADRDANENLHTAIFNQDSSLGGLNGVVTSISGIGPQDAGGITIGKTHTDVETGFLTGTVSELIFYNSDQSANREAIEANINKQYDIY